MHIIHTEGTNIFSSVVVDGFEIFGPFVYRYDLLTKNSIKLNTFGILIIEKVYVDDIPYILPKVSFAPFPSLQV